MLCTSKPKKRTTDAKKRNRKVVFISLDDPIDSALERFIAAQRIPPERAAVGLMALLEFLTREGYLPNPAAS